MSKRRDKLDDFDKAKMLASALRLMPWIEDVLNGKIIGTHAVVPVDILGCRFHLSVEPKQFTDRVGRRYETQTK